MSLKLLINATILNGRRMTGLGVYTRSLLSELIPLLCRDDQVHSIRLIGDRQRVSELFGEQIRHDKISIDHVATNHPVLRLLSLNRIVGRKKWNSNSLFYSPTHHGVIVDGIRQVLTIHDLFALLFPRNYRLQNYYFRFYMPSVLAKTDTVITDSKNTAQDLRSFFEASPRTVTVYAAIRNDLASITPKAVPQLIGDRFFLFVGPNYQYKNADRLIDAFAQFHRRDIAKQHRLVFAGGQSPYVDSLKSRINSSYPYLEKDILFLGYVSEEELIWLYQQAVAAMVTTLYEGFGLPALEAMHYGCTVVASNVASLPEVCADAAIYVDPYNMDNIAEAMWRLTNDQKLRAELIKRGARNVQRFDWLKAAHQVHDVLKQSVE